MNRFQDLLKAMGKVADPKIEEGDETAIANNPRNWATDKLNMILPESMQVAPQTVAEDKQFLQNLPETMAGATMGAVKTILSPKGHGAIHQILPEAQPVGSVRMQPSTQNLLDEARALSMNKKELQGPKVLERFKELFSNDIPKQKELHRTSPGGYDSWKQEMLNKIRRGEL